MYINPFVAGVLFVVLVESVGTVLYGIITSMMMEDDDGKKK